MSPWPRRPAGYRAPRPSDPIDRLNAWERRMVVEWMVICGALAIAAALAVLFWSVTR